MGMTLEIFGALLLANRYLNSQSWATNIWGLISAFKRRRRNKLETHPAEEIAELSGDRAADALRGIGILCLGFIFRSLPSIADLFIQHPPNH
jgi:hypothetical protein